MCFPVAFEMEVASGHLKKLPSLKGFQVKTKWNIVFWVYSDRSLALIGNPASNSLDFPGCLFFSFKVPSEIYRALLEGNTEEFNFNIPLLTMINCTLLQCTVSNIDELLIQWTEAKMNK